MDVQQKLPYVEFAKQFDQSQHALTKRSSPVPGDIPLKEKEPSLVVPSIYVVTRAGGNRTIQDASWALLTQTLEPGSRPCSAELAGQ
jgi:hypothetical protein